MATDVFWTGFFTFGGGLVGAIGTYIGVRSQRVLRLRELDLERARHRNEEGRQRKEEEDKAREQRRGLYLKYLGALDGVVHATADGDLDNDGLAKRWAEFIAADDELELGGTDAVMEATYPLYKAVREIMESYGAVIENPGKKWPQDALRGLEELRPDYNPARADVVAAMREDLHDSVSDPENRPPG